MPAKMTVSVYDKVHRQNAQGLAYDLWRIRDPNNRVNIKSGTIDTTNQHVLVEVNKQEDLGSFELILYVKDYFQRFPDHTEMADGRFILPFGMNQFNEDEHLNIQIEPSAFTCTL
jgi:5-hydroxyisourate hydrolase-like protein (transthyretin family)